jgi:predicted PhzF superfamily epimerase YddE/YHI9
MSTPSTLTYTVFDSFTSKRFRGNPAAVILIDKPLLDHQYIEIAREFNLSQTGFVLLPSDEPSKDPQSKSFGIRWFTKKNEIALCGHVTLAAARLLFDEPKLVPSLTNVLRFNSLSGELTARRVGDSDIELEFPAGKLREVDREYVAKTQGVVNRALEKEAKVLYVGEGLGESFGKFLLIELEETARLEGAEIESQFLVSFYACRSPTEFTPDPIDRCSWSSFPMLSLY